MKKRYAVIAGMAFLIPLGTTLSAGQAMAADTAAAWATMDANADGALSPDEVAGTPWQAPFTDMDGNSDGKVTQDEFQAFADHRDASQADDTDQ